MTAIALSLEAVIVAVTDERPRLLVVTVDDGRYGIPSGPLDAESDQTLERALRRWVRHQSGLDVGYVEQLYTFGDRDRRIDEMPTRWLSVAYLALVREEQPAPGSAWMDYYRLFPWEDHRDGTPAMLTALLPRLEAWAGGDPARTARLHVTFGVDSTPWDPMRVLERYELLYEARLVPEAYLDRRETPPDDLAGSGLPLAYDHRRVAASALSRLRGKLTYRPVVFELLPGTFTLTQLQQTVEALVGSRIHKQNFRRVVERNRLVEGTGRSVSDTGGRPAALFRFREEVLGERPRPGLLRPRL